MTDGRQQQIGHLKGHEGPVWKVGRERAAGLMRFLLMRGHEILDFFWGGGIKVDAHVLWQFLEGFPPKRIVCHIS